MKKSTKKHPKNKLVHRAVKHSHWVVGLVVLAFNFLTWFGLPGVANAAAQGYVWPYEEQQFINILNGARSVDVVRSGCLTDAARAWSKVMASSNTTDHSPNNFIDSYCDDANVGAGEIVLGTSGFGFADEVFSAFQNSPAHNGIMRNSIFDHAGVGFFYDTAHSKVWVTGIFLDCNNLCSADVDSAPSDNLGGSNAACASISAPSTVKASQSFSADVNFRNNGNTTWFGSTHSAVSRSNTNWGVSSVKIGLGNPSYHINPGREGWISTTFKAPSTGGTYTFAWQLKSGGSFGATCSKSITVKGASTSTNSGSSSGGSSTGSNPGSSGSTSGTPNASGDPGNDANPTSNAPVSPAQTQPTEEKKSAIEAVGEVANVQQLKSAPIWVKLVISGVSVALLGGVLMMRKHIFGFHFPKFPHLPKMHLPFIR